MSDGPIYSAASFSQLQFIASKALIVKAARPPELIKLFIIRIGFWLLTNLAIVWFLIFVFPHLQC